MMFLITTWISIKAIFLSEKRVDAFLQTSNKVYLSGINLDEWVAPIPGLPCLTGL